VSRQFSVAVGILLWTGLGCASPRVDETTAIRLHMPDADDPTTYFEVVGPVVKQTGALAQDVFTVSVKRPDDAHPPAMLGTYHVAPGALRFIPRYPLVPGVRYRAVVDADSESVEAEFVLPKSGSVATSLTHVYPSTGDVPENLLKFYLHFSAPMSHGDAYRHIHLFDAAGRRIADPFLELGEELWDREGMRFTLYFDPGRIKRGLKPREDVGPVLEQSNAYTLVVDRDWLDAAGRPLEREHRKPFRVGPPDTRQPDVATWDVEEPVGGRNAPLIVQFPEPLDHALLRRLLKVTDAAHRAVPGRIKVQAEETRWVFTPKDSWQPGTYHLEVDTTLEDLAGNSIGRPFEIDLFERVSRRVETESVRIVFHVRAANDPH